MIDLRVLGTFELRRDGVDVDAVLDQPKRFALLAWLAVAQPAGLHHRETLLALFWPELDPTRARHALRQALHFLRHTIGENAFVTRGDLVGIGADVWSDVSAFDEAVADARDAEAAALYRGQLLPGFYVPGSPEFESWLEAERTRLTRAAITVFWRLAKASHEAGAGAQAAEWAERAGSLYPGDEAVLRQVLQLSHAAGETDRALEFYTSFARRHEQEYDLPMSAESEALVARIRAEGSSRATTPVPVVPSTPPVRRNAEPATVTAAASPAQTRFRWIAGGAMLAVATVLLWLLPRAQPTRAARDDSRSVVAVLPFATAGSDPAYAWLGEGIADLLFTRFSGAAVLRAVDVRTVLAACPAVGCTADALPSDSAVALANRLGADLVLTGRAHVVLDSLIVYATLIDVASGSVRAVASGAGRIDNLAPVLDQVAARVLGAAEDEPNSRLALLTTTSHEALLAYLAGRRGVRRGEYNAAVRDYDRALQLDSAFALAAIELVDAMGWTASPPGVRARATSAIALGYRRLSERDRAHVHAYYGAVMPPVGTISHPEATRHRERFVQLAPDRPEAWYALGDLLFHSGALMGLPDARTRAAGAFSRAGELDPQLAGAAEHLLQLAALAFDTTSVRKWMATYLHHNAKADDADFVRWAAAHALADGAALAQLRGRWAELSDLALVRIMQAAQEDAVGLDDARRAADVLWLRHRTVGLEPRQLAAVHTYALNTGRRRQANEIVSELARLEWSYENGPNNRIFEAVYWDGDPAAAAEQLQWFSAVLRDTASAKRHDLRLTAACAIAHWRLTRHDTVGINGLVREMQRIADTAGRVSRQRHEFCLSSTRALLAALRSERESVQQQSMHLDSLVAHWLGTTGITERYTPVVTARLLRVSGDPTSARVAARRRYYGGTTYYLTPLLLEEARAAAASNHPSAPSIYRHYLLLRADPDPELRPQRDSARFEMEQLKRHR